MNRQTRPEATTHGGKRRLHLRIGHSSMIVSSVALAFCLALLSFSILSVLDTSQRAYASIGSVRFSISTFTSTLPLSSPKIPKSSLPPTPTPTATTPPPTPTPTPTATTPPPTPTPTATTPPPTPTPTATTPPPTPTATTPPPTPTPIPGVTPTATKAVPTATPKAGGVGAPPPGGVPTQNPGSGKPTPPTKGGTPNSGYPTPTPAGGNDQGNGGTTQTNVNGDIATTGTTSDSTGLIVGASAGVVLLLILAGIGGWLLYNKRMDEQAQSSIYPDSAPSMQPEQAGWNSLQANAGLGGTAPGDPGAPTLMQQPISFGMNDSIPTTPPPDYNAMHQSMTNAGQHSEGMAAHAGEAGYPGYHNEYATIQSHSPLDEQALLGYNNGEFGQVPETPLPTNSTESYLDEMMQQAQVGLFVLPDKEA